MTTNKSFFKPGKKPRAQLQIMPQGSIRTG